MGQCYYITLHLKPNQTKHNYSIQIIIYYSKITLFPLIDFLNVHLRCISPMEHHTKLKGIGTMLGRPPQRDHSAPTYRGPGPTCRRPCSDPAGVDSLGSYGWCRRGTGCRTGSGSSPARQMAQTSLLSRLCRTTSIQPHHTRSL